MQTHRLVGVSLPLVPFQLFAANRPELLGKARGNEDHRGVWPHLVGTALVLAWAILARAQDPINPITTVAGGGANGSVAASALIPLPTSVAVDNAGNAFVVSYPLNQVYMVSPSGSLLLVAGNGVPGFSADGGPATEARLTSPQGVAVDGAGNVFISEGIRVRRVDAVTGIITTVAGSSVQGFSGDDGPATSASLSNPRGLAFDAGGNLFIADTQNHRVRRVEAATGIITTVAGDGTTGPPEDGVPAVSSALFIPTDVALDSGGNLLIADLGHNLVRRVDAATGIITTVAGGGNGGDGGPAMDALLAVPQGLAVDGADNLFIAETGLHRVRRVDAVTGIITTVAGNGTQGFSGDNGPAVDATLTAPFSVAVDSVDNLFIADSYNNRVRRVEAATGIISTVAGGGSGGDGGPATSAVVVFPSSAAADAEVGLLVGEAYGYRVRRVDPATDVISTVVGNGFAGFSGDGGPATAASLEGPAGLVFDSARNVFIADASNNRVRRMDVASGIITTVAGNGQTDNLCQGDGSLAVDAALGYVSGVALDSEDNLFVFDRTSKCVRRVDAVTGVMTRVAGTPYIGSDQDGVPATEAALRNVRGLAVDPAGNLVIADAGSSRVRRIDAFSGIITTVAGTLFQSGFSGDGGPATDATLRNPGGVAVDSVGNMFIADSDNNRVRRVDAATGVITTVAGNGTFGFSGDGGPATAATLTAPAGAALQGDGAVLIVDAWSNRIRRVTLTPGAGLSSSELDFPNRLVGTEASESIALTSAGGLPLLIAGITGDVDFAQTNDCPISPATLNPGSTCTITVAFAPMEAGMRSGSITITSNTPGGPQMVALSGAGTDFAVGAASGGSTSANVSAGGTATYDLSVAPSGFVGTATLACAWRSAQPRGTSCAVSPASVNLDGTQPAAFTATVTTTRRTLAPPGFLPEQAPLQPLSAPLGQVWLAWLATLTLLGLGLMALDRRGPRQLPAFTRLAALAGLMLVALLWVACGGGGGGGTTSPPNPNGTPAGTYTLTVTATADGASRTADLTLMVN